MKRDSRLSGVLHVLLHLAESAGPTTSAHLANIMKTNPVVIRRIMGSLREHRFVHSQKGHGGGWTLARDLKTVTLRDIYLAIGAPGLFAIGNRNETPGCLVEKAVNGALDEALKEAEAVLLARFGQVTLESLSAEFHAGMVKHGRAAHQGDTHEE